MTRLPLALALALILAFPAAAQETRETRLAAARVYVAQTMEQVDIEAMVRSMYQPVLDQVAANGTTLSAQQLAEIDALYQSTTAEGLRAIMLQQDEVMADLFTLEEIEAISAFYASPVGSSVMAKLPQLSAAIQPQIAAFVQSVVPQLVPELQRIIRG